MKGIHNYEANVYVYHKKVIENVYNDQHYKDFLHEPGLQSSSGNFTLCTL